MPGRSGCLLLKARHLRFQAENKGSKDENEEGTDVLETENGNAEDTEDKKKEEQKLVSVSHVLTNVIVLQEFLLELAALVQVRAGLFEEVKFV